MNPKRLRRFTYTSAQEIEVTKRVAEKEHGAAMRAPELDVELSSGERVRMRTLWEQGPVALVFLRHLGCLFCRKQVADLARRPDLNVVFVSIEPAAPTEAFRIASGSPHRFLSDSTLALRVAFEIPRGELSQIIHPGVLIAGVRAAIEGHRQSRPAADPMQSPAVVVLDARGEVVWRRVGKHMGEGATVDELEHQLRLADQTSSQTT